MIGIAVILIILAVVVIYFIYSAVKIKMLSPGNPAEPEQRSEFESKKLYDYVHHLSVKIGSRSFYQYGKIKETEDYIKKVLEDLGLSYELQAYNCQGKSFSNIIVTIPGQKEPKEIFLIGAHYDTVPLTPGADDNASAVAVLLEICRILKDYRPGKTLKLVFFVLEEPPHFRTSYMGSYVYAKKAREMNEQIFGMISLEMLGYYNDTRGGQTFPLPLMNFFYPTVPNFIAVVGNLKSKKLVKQIEAAVKKSSSIPVETLSTIKFVPGVDFSDHASFWRMGYPAVMITDTAFYRNPHYHTPGDTIDTLNFEKMAEVLKGLIQAAKDLVGE